MSRKRDHSCENSIDGCEDDVDDSVEQSAVSKVACALQSYGLTEASDPDPWNNTKSSSKKIKSKLQPVVPLEQQQLEDDYDEELKFLCSEVTLVENTNVEAHMLKKMPYLA